MILGRYLGMFGLLGLMNGTYLNEKNLGRKTLRYNYSWHN